MSIDLPLSPKIKKIVRVYVIGMLILLVISIGFYILLLGCNTPRQTARLSSSKNSLKQLGLAQHNYHDIYQALPPGIISSDSGEILHGCPTLLLPFIHETHLYNSINLGKPWWDEENQRVMNTGVMVYSNPMIQRETSSITGMGYAFNLRVFPTNAGMKLNTIQDGAANTFMGGEIAYGIRAWFEPFHLRDPAAGLNKGPSTFGSPYFDGPDKEYYLGVRMMMMDGSVRAISDDIDPTILRALATPNAGDDLKGFVP